MNEYFRSILRFDVTSLIQFFSNNGIQLYFFYYLPVIVSMLLYHIHFPVMHNLLHQNHKHRIFILNYIILKIIRNSMVMPSSNESHAFICLSISKMFGCFSYSLHLFHMFRTTELNVTKKHWNYHRQIIKKVKLNAITCEKMNYRSHIVQEEIVFIRK